MGLILFVLVMITTATLIVCWPDLKIIMKYLKVKRETKNRIKSDEEI